jgi:NAD(P)-dependent dehydrogenase (short-subunit alcohol dehydrogenase family)
LDFTGATVLVVGVGDGIGAVVAERFAAAGALVVAAAAEHSRPDRRELAEGLER